MTEKERKHSASCNVDHDPAGSECRQVCTGPYYCPACVAEGLND
jgi:hypothetical protein